MRHWGIISVGEGELVGIMVNSLDKGESVQTGNAKNQKGQITDIAAHGQEETISVSGVLDVEQGKKALEVRAGSVMTVTGKKYLVNQSDQAESNEAYVNVTIGGLTADGASLRALDGTVTVNPAPAQQ